MCPGGSTVDYLDDREPLTGTPRTQWMPVHSSPKSVRLDRPWIAVTRVMSGRVALRVFDRGRGARWATGRDSRDNFADDQAVRLSCDVVVDGRAVGDEPCAGGCRFKVVGCGGAVVLAFVF